MPFGKDVKASVHSKRFQTKFRRRREHKTDYRARRRMIQQPNDSYGKLKYRMVVRISNYKVICQIVTAHIGGDKTHCAAESLELVNYGVKVGLTNYSAAYLTGLLCARRMLKMKGKDSVEGQKEPDGSIQEFDEAGFTVNLDIGLSRATLGAKVFAVMKGASDGGLHIPHNGRRFPGYDPSTKKNDQDVLRDHIMGAHVANYMRILEEEDEEAYQKQFSRFIKANIGPDDIEPMYTKAMQLIRKNPDHIPAPKKVYNRLPKMPKMTLEQKKAAREARKRALEEELDALPERPVEESEDEEMEEE